MKKHEKQAIRFGSELRKIREQKDLTQQQLADNSELDVRTIQRMEKGEIGVGLHVLFAVSEALAVSPAVFFENIFLNQFTTALP